MRHLTSHGDETHGCGLCRRGSAGGQLAAVLSRGQHMLARSENVASPCRIARARPAAARSRSRHRHRHRVSRPDACRDGSSQRLEHRILAAPGRCASVEMRCRTRGRIRSCPGQISRNPPCKSPDLARCDRECNVRPTQSQLQRTATGNSRAGRLVTRASAHARPRRVGSAVS